MFYLTEAYIIILLGIYQRKSIAEIAKDIDRSRSLIQKKEAELENLGYVINPVRGKYSGRELTEKGRGVLKKHGLLKE